MREKIRTHAVPLLVVLSLIALWGWGLFVYEKEHSPPSLQPYGFFGDSLNWNKALCLALTEDAFVLYWGDNDQLFDIGTLSQSFDVTFLLGENATYSLVTTSSALYLTGGDLADNTRMELIHPVPITAGYLKHEAQSPEWTDQYSPW